MTTSSPAAPANKGLILVVEDERSIADLIRLYLSREGFGVHVESDGAAGLAAVRTLRPVAVVLDVGLPSLEGTDVCRILRSEGDWTPVLFVTARNDEIDRIRGLDLGGDDYLSKPFPPRELVSRVKAVLRRSQGAHVAPAIVVGPVRLEPSTRRVTIGDEHELTLTATEFDLLAVLLRRPGHVLSRSQLLSEVWGYHAAAGTRTVDVHIAQLRAKLGEDIDVIRTVRGVGYASFTTESDPLT